MTVSSSTARNQYSATGGQTVFAYTFEVYDKSDIVVLQNGAVINEGTNYTVSGVGNDAGGNITLTVGATNGDVITIYRDMTLERLTDYQQSGDFLAQDVNDDFDRLWLAVQQNAQDQSLAVKKPITDSASLDMTLPSSTNRANTVLGFGPTGEPIVGPSTTDVDSLVNISADIALLADIQDGTIATNAITDVAANEANVTAVAGNNANITAVAGNASNINAVVANAANINIVAANVTDVTNFADVYQGGKSADPTLRNDSSALQAGDLYFNTVSNELRVYTGTAWRFGTEGIITPRQFTGDGSTVIFDLGIDPNGENNTQIYIDGVYQQKTSYGVSGSVITFSEAPPLNASIEVMIFAVGDFVPGTFNTEIQTATAGQTVFTLTTSVYTPGSNNIQVHVNGLHVLGGGNDYNETNGNTVTFTYGLNEGDVVAFLTGRIVNDAVAAESVSYDHGGTGSLARTLTSKLQETVSVKDFGAVGDGVTDDTAAIQAAIDAVGSSGGGTILGIGGETYRITTRLNIRYVHGIVLDLQGATLLDEVQGTAAEFGGAPNSLIFIRECTNIKVRNFKYLGGTRNNDSGFGLIYLGVNAGSDVWGNSNDNVNSNIVIEDIIANNIPTNAYFIQVSGNTSNVLIQNINLYGDCLIGFNAEYSLAPYDDYELINAQYAGIEDRYGVHAYNITVRNFNGFNNSICTGFLRAAGVYNITFENCYGYNVNNFIYNYSGDRSIYRIGQNVVYNNCSSFVSETNVSLTGNAVTIVATEDDGSTGGVLPTWTKYDFKTIFNACEFQTNKNAPAVRYIGNDGSTIFNACTFRDSTVGLRMGGSTGVWVDYPQTALTLNDCMFIDNTVDVDIRTSPGTSFNNCQFKGASGTDYPVKFTDCDNVTFTNCQFSGILADTNYVNIDAASTGTIFNNCRFSGQTTAAAIRSVNAVNGMNNVNADTALTHVASGFKQSLIEEVTTFTPTLVGSTSGSQAGTGQYTKIGNTVFFNMYITYANDFSIQGTVTITGMPFTSTLSDAQLVNLGETRFNLSTGYDFFATLSGSTISIYEVYSGTTIHSAITQANLAASTVRIWVSGHYFID